MAALFRWRRLRDEAQARAPLRGGRLERRRGHTQGRHPGCSWKTSAGRWRTSESIRRRCSAQARLVGAAAPSPGGRARSKFCLSPFRVPSRWPSRRSKRLLMFPCRTLIWCCGPQPSAVHWRRLMSGGGHEGQDRKRTGRARRQEQGGGTATDWGAGVGGR